MMRPLMPAVSALPTNQCQQLGQRIADQTYTEADAFDVCLWLIERKQGYPINLDLVPFQPLYTEPGPSL